MLDNGNVGGGCAKDDWENFAPNADDVVLSLHVASVATGLTCHDRDRTPATVALVDAKSRVVGAWVLQVAEEDLVSYLTPLSGVTQQILSTGTQSLGEVRRELSSKLEEYGGADRVIFVGQSPDCYLKCMGLEEGALYKRVIDLAEEFRVGRIRFSLEHEAKVLLNWKKPKAKKGKQKVPLSSAECAKMSMRLYNKLMDLKRDPDEFARCKQQLCDAKRSLSVVRQIGYNNVSAWNGVCVRSRKGCRCGPTLEEQMKEATTKIEDSTNRLASLRCQRETEFANRQRVLTFAREMVRTCDSWSGKTPLHDAVLSGDTKLAEWIVAAKANVDAETSCSQTALHCAAMEGHTQCIELLVSAKASVNIQDKDGEASGYNWSLGSAHRNGACRGKTALHYAALSTSCLSVRLLLGAKAVVDIQDAEGKTALHYATQGSNCAYVKLLLDANACVNIQDKDDEVSSGTYSMYSARRIHSSRRKTALHYAMINSDHESARLLLDAKASTDIQDAQEKTALHFAACGSTDCVRLLVAAKARLDPQDVDGNTALHYATSESFDLLLKAGASTTLKNNMKHTPSVKAASLASMKWCLRSQTAETKAMEEAAKVARHEHEKMLSMISPVVNFCREKHLNNALSQHDSDRVKLLVHAKVDLCDNDYSYDSPLRIAVTVAVDKNDTEVLTLLLDSKANINPKNANLARIAVQKKSATVLEVLLRAKANIRWQDSWPYNDSLLQRAVELHDLSTAKMLLSFNVDLTTKEHNPLEHAIKHCDVDFVNLLMSKKADVNATCRCGSVLVAALHRIRLEASREHNSGAEEVTQAQRIEDAYHVLEGLLKAKADVNSRTPLLMAVEHADERAVRLLLTYKADVTAQLHLGWQSTTILQTASSLSTSTSTKLVSVLLEAKASVNAANQSGGTPLHAASTAAVADTLIQHKANLNTRDNDGQTALLHALRHRGFMPLAEALLDGKADVNVKDCRNCTALHAAVSSCSPQSVDMIIAAKANVNARPADGTTALLHAVMSGKETAAQALIAAKARVNARNHDGHTTLHVVKHTMKYGRDPATVISMTDLLVQAKARLNAVTDNDGQTLLHMVVKSECSLSMTVPYVQHLLGAKANPNVENYDGKTPLQLARDDPLVKLLVGAKADVNKGAGDPVLHQAMHRQDVDSVKLLLASKADVDATAWRAAANTKGRMNKQLVRLLKKAQAKAKSSRKKQNDKSASKTTKTKSGENQGGGGGTPGTV